MVLIPAIAYDMRPSKQPLLRESALLTFATYFAGAPVYEMRQA